MGRIFQFMLENVTNKYKLINSHNPSGESSANKRLVTIDCFDISIQQELIIFISIHSKKYLPIETVIFFPQKFVLSNI